VKRKSSLKLYDKKVNFLRPPILNYFSFKVSERMFSWFGHVDRMDDRRRTKEIYEADLGGDAGRGTLLDQIGQVLEKGQVKSTRNR
jgi:hypothetical protein